MVRIDDFPFGGVPEDDHNEVIKLDELGIKPIMMSFYIEEFREKSLIVHGVLQ